MLFVDNEDILILPFNGKLLSSEWGWDFNTIGKLSQSSHFNIKLQNRLHHPLIKNSANWELFAEFLFYFFYGRVLLFIDPSYLFFDIIHKILESCAK